ncbi:hypothetical protein [Nocardia australiensis]|uniref:hypothetical protein n=1 Tax=Nocardia australiensis TaxID=2887191 RepID=UPI001D14AE1E|nr:hypothetical protein [Nocardia australiensis]
MDNFTVDVSCLAGFKLDLQDLETNFISNTSRLLPGVSLPAGSTGLVATLAPAFEKFQSATSAAHQNDLTSVGTLAADLDTAGSRYRATDETYAGAIGAITPGDGAAAQPPSDSRDIKRFSGLQLPSLPEVQENQYTVRQVVTSSIDLISPYDERLHSTIGIKPAADYLTPLLADWEVFQAIGKRISLLGINDYVTSENLISGTRWLQGSWSGDASQAFGTSANTLGQRTAGRSIDLDAVSKIIENGGACLERLVYNQAIGLSGGILQSMSYLDSRFPLGVWAQLIERPMPESKRSEITSAVDLLKKSAESRKIAITTIIERISRALDYSPGRTAPAYNASDFEIPDKVVVDMGVMRYGFGDNVWWENSIASATDPKTPSGRV